MRVTAEQENRIICGAMRHVSALMASRNEINMWTGEQQEYLARHAIDLMLMIELEASKFIAAFKPSAESSGEKA